MKFSCLIGILLLIICIFSKAGNSFAQNRGLHFNGQEVVQDNRTGLTLNPESDLCFDSEFELSFDIKFTLNQKDYYGYIFRFVSDENLNIDLIYDQKPEHHENFKLVIGNKFSKIAFHLEKTLLFNQWNRFKIKFDTRNDRIFFYAGTKVLVEQKAGIKNSTCYKFLFGANQHKEFKTVDVPPMNIRDIRIYKGDDLMYYWPLDEAKGNIANDSVHQIAAAVTNPAWISAMHNQWKMVGSFTVSGNASVAFDPLKEVAHIVGSSALYKYNLANQKLYKLPYSSKHLMQAGSQSVFNPIQNKLYNFYTDKHYISGFNISAGRWESEYQLPKELTVFWQANKFISPADSSLYVIGGYGQRRYKNLVQRYSFSHQKWDVVQPTGDPFFPRYLAAIGADYKRQAAYIIGGYGSESGQQMLSPKNYYDLMRFDIAKRSFKKVYSLPKPTNDFAFAGSLVIDSGSKSFYGLIFPNDKFNSQLQLIQGSLTKPEYKVIANRIPYLFHDIRSYADIYWCPVSRKLIAVTLFNKVDQQTDVKIFTIAFPPENIVVRKKITVGNTYITLIAVLLVGGLIIYVWYSYKKKVRGKSPIDTKPSYIIPSQPMYSVPVPVARPMSINLFGNLQLTDTEGNDITKSLSPLLKELMLLILLFGVNKEGGISSKQIDDILWFDKSEKGAKNNRSVNIGKLKAILEKVGNLKVSKDTGYWRIETHDLPVYIDYLVLNTILKDPVAPERDTVENLLSIIQRGIFLSGTDYDWLDEFKSRVSANITEYLLRYTNSVTLNKEPQFLIAISNAILSIDLVSEEAMLLKCKTLNHVGKNTMARSAYEKFCRDYRSLFDNDYPKAFEAVVG